MYLLKNVVGMVRVAASLAEVATDTLRRAEASKFDG